MSFVRALLTVSVTACIAGPPAAAQRARLDCPRPVREQAHRTAPVIYLELAAGFSRPFLYHNAAGALGSNYRFISRLSPYGTVLGVAPLNETIEIFAGASLTQVWQGIGFSYQDGAGTARISGLTGATVLSVPVGIRYRAAERVQLSAGPYLAYASHRGQSNSSGSGNFGVLADHRFDSPDYTALNVGLRLGADVSITSRFAITLNLGADSRPGASSSSVIDPDNPRGPLFEAELKPYLFHAGFGLSYKLFYRSE